MKGYLLQKLWQACGTLLENQADLFLNMATVLLSSSAVQASFSWLVSARRYGTEY